MKIRINYFGAALALIWMSMAFSVQAESGFVGMQIQGIDAKAAKALGLKSVAGVLIKDVAIGEAGAISGFRRGDLITSFAGKKIRNFQDLVDGVVKTKPGQKIAVVVSRQGKTLNLILNTGKRPKSWKITKGAFRNYNDLGFTVAAITEKIRQRFKLRWGTIGLVITLVDEKSEVANGLKSGDVIVSANMRDVWHPNHLTKQINDVKSAGRKGMLIMVESASGFRYSILPLK